MILFRVRPSGGQVRIDTYNGHAGEAADGHTGVIRCSLEEAEEYIALAGIVPWVEVELVMPESADPYPSYGTFERYRKYYCRCRECYAAERAAARAGNLWRAW